VLELRLSTPRPLVHFDVGSSTDGSLCYRSDRGVVGTSHPSVRPDPLVNTGSILLPDGSMGTPLFPPSDSDLVLCADASGAMCYYNTALGDAQWDAPAGSTLVADWLLVRPAEPFPDPPPCLSPKISLNSLRGTGWHPLFRDGDNCVHLYHAETGTVRDAPWIALRTESGIVFFVNLVTGITRWMPPHRWADSWISRPGYDTAVGTISGIGVASPFDGFRLGQQLQPPAIARCRVEGGAPYLHERGTPPWSVDSCDTALTHPAFVVVVP